MKKCKQCEVYMPARTSHDQRKKFCSHKCYTESLIGRKNHWGHKISAALKGKKKTQKHVLAVIEANRKSGFKNRPKGDKHPQWKGNKAGYSAIHDWARKKIDPPKMCATCGAQNFKSRRKNGYLTNYLQLSNVSGLYKRKLEDWWWLCPSCHWYYDHGRENFCDVFKRQGRSLR